MDATGIALITALALNIILGVVIIASNRRRFINVVAALFIAAVSLWIGAIFCLRLTLNPLYGKIAFGSAASIPVLLLAFASKFPRPRYHLRSFAWLFGIGAFFVVASFTDHLMFSGQLSLVGNAIVPEHNGPLYIAYILYFLVYFCLITVVAVRNYRASSIWERVQAKYILWGVSITVGLVVACNLILPLFKIYALNAVSPVFTLLITVSMTYSIIRHRLFSIHLVVARSIAYSLLLITLAGLYGAAFLGVSGLFFSDSQGSFYQELVYDALAVILAFSFQPLRRFFEHITDRVFYRDRYDSQVVINDFSKVLVSELHLDRILKKALTALCESVHIQFAQIIVFNNDRVYRVEHYGPPPPRLMVAPELRLLDRPMLVADELDGGERKALLEEHGIRVSLTLRTREDFVGYLLLGDKLSGDIYSTQDIELLEIIGKELAVAILNAKSYAEIQAFNLTLQARVDHATNRLRVANRHLKELDHAKDEFISMASHQLRTPLTTIKGYLSMMLEGDSGRLTAAQKDFVGYAFGASERMVNLISDLLNVSRLQAGRFLIQTKPTDMVRMIEEEVRQLQTHAAAKHIQLIFEPPAQALPPAEIDDNKTRQVIMNFIDNAIYYTQNGEVRVVLEQTGDRVRLEVRDTGIGVPEAAKRKLFTKFFRADNAQSVRPDGTGLGLYLAKRVIEDQGGTIIFSSVEGKGSVFGFELPFKPKAANHEEHHGRRRHAK